MDDYVNTKTLQLLSQKQSGVEVILFTENGHGKRGFLTTAVVNDFIQEFPPLRIKPDADCHDRLIVLEVGSQSDDCLFLDRNIVGTEGFLSSTPNRKGRRRFLIEYPLPDIPDRQQQP